MEMKLIFFLILFYLGLVHSLYYQDVTLRENRFQYQIDDTCYFRFLILVGEPSYTYGFIIETNNATIDGNVASISNIGNTIDSSLFEIYLESTIGYFNHSFIAIKLVPEVSSTRKLTANEPVEFFLNYECSGIPEDLEILNLSPRGLELDVFGKISSYYKYENVKSLVEIRSDCHLCSSTTLNNNNYYKIDLQITDAVSYENAIPQLVLYLYEGLNVTYTPDSYFDLNVYDQITNVKGYPDFYFLETEPIYRFAKNYGPVITFDSNNTHNTLPLYVQTAGFGGAGAVDFYYRPISSKDGITKYIANIDLNLDTSNYSIYAQNKEDYSYFMSSKAYINDYSYGFMDTSFSLNMSSENNYFTIKSFLYEDILASHRYQYENSIDLSFPFGVSLEENVFTFKFSFFLNPTLNEPDLFSVDTFNNDPNNPFSGGYYLTLQPPAIENRLSKFNDIEFIHLFDHSYILRVKVFSEASIYKIMVNNKYYYLERLVEEIGNNSTYDFHVNLFNPINSIKINGNEALEYEYYDIANLKYFNNPKNNNEDFDIFKISFSKMLYEEIDVTNQTVGNIFYFNYTNINSNTPISLVLYDPLNNFRKLGDDEYPTDNLWPAKWNASLSLFQVEFYVKANSISGKIPYALFFDKDNYVPSNVLPDSAQFTVISKNIDLYGPIFENILKFPDDPVPRFASNSIIHKNELTNNNAAAADDDNNILRYRFNIIDDFNGFKEGFITFKGFYDGSLYNFTFTSNDAISGDKYNGTYELEFHIDFSNCFEQGLVITEVQLVDEQGYNSTYSLYPSSDGYSQSNSLSNPFINYISAISKIAVIYQKCQIETQDSTSPELLEFQLINGPNSTNPIDVGSNNRFLEFKLVATDSDRGLLKNQIPIIYISTLNLNVYQCKNATINILDQYTSQFNYMCLLPIGFGYPAGAIFQIFTITSNGGNFKSYTTLDLETLGFAFNINDSSIIMSLNYPSISGTNKIKSNDNEFWIFGRGFHDVIGVSLVLPNNTKIPVDIDQNLTSALKLKNLPKGITKCNVEFHYQSNQYYIDPYEINIIKGIENEMNNLPINPNQQCEGKPLCGGSSNGYCASTGCICYSPWIGKDCTSKSIDIPALEINQTSPTSNTKYLDNNIVYKSIVSIVSLREIDILGKTVSEHKFTNNWEYNKVSDSIHQYKTNISTSTINVQLKWFKDESNISFAGQQLLMNPNTIKYSIDIDKYPFKSKLNSLDLIMSASIESSKTNDICSSQDFGNTTTGDNSNYMKVQVENQSLYGRFIKRAIYDYIAIKKVSNRLVESDKPNNQYSSNTLIAITMNYFSDHITIDPDFSVLLNSNSASKNSDNSICSNLNKNNNKLSASKLAGIIIGSVAFVAIIITSVIYHFYKNKKQKEFESNIKLKLNEMNK